MSTAKQLNITIGRFIRKERKLRGWGQSYVAEKLGVSYQQIHKYERGMNALCAHRIAQFSEVLGIPVSAFFGQATEQVTAPEPDEGREISVSIMRSLQSLKRHERIAIVGLVRSLARKVA